MSFYPGTVHSWFSVGLQSVCPSLWCSVLLISLCVISLWLQEQLLEIRKSCLAYSFRSFLLGDWRAALSWWGDRYVTWASGRWRYSEESYHIDSRVHHCNPDLLLVSTSQSFEVPLDSTDTRQIQTVAELFVSWVTRGGRGALPLSFLPPWVLVL